MVWRRSIAWPMAQPETKKEIAAERVISRRWKRWLFIALGILILLYVIYLLREIWLPLALAFLIAMVLDPVVDRLERRGFTRFWGSLLIFVAFFVSVGAILYLTVPAVAGQAQSVNEQVNVYLPDRSAKGIERFLEENHVSPGVRPFVLRAMDSLNKTATRSSGWIVSHSMEVASNLIWLVIIPIVAFYALKDFHLILAKTLLLVPKDKRDFVQTMVSETTAIFARYMRGLAVVSLLNGVATWLLLLAFRVPGSLMLGLIAGLIYGVPYFGAIVTVLLTAGVAFVAGGSNYMMLVVVASILLHQVVFDQIITPRILGGHVGLHPILAIFALLVGNVLLGLLGMILAVPVAACIQIAVVAMMPKLSYEIDLSGEVEAVSEEMKDSHVEVSASEELHHAVNTAVETLEAQVESDEEATPDASLRH